jgi:hypothetical protein
MKERKSKPEWTKETAGLGIKNQVIIIRIKTGYTRATPSYIIEKRDKTDCRFCNSELTVVNILWTWQKTEQDRLRMNITKNV